MNKTLSTSTHLKLLSKHIAELVHGLQPMAASETDDATRLKSIDALLRLKKAMLETRLLEEELRERLQQRGNRGSGSTRKAGISPEALEEVGRLLGLSRGGAEKEQGCSQLTGPGAPAKWAIE